MLLRGEYMSVQQTVVILGNQGSGTSMTAGIISKLGVAIGENLFRILDNKLRCGYGEDMDFVTLNSQIVNVTRQTGMNPHDKDNILAQKEKFSDEIQKLIKHKQKFGLWGWKNPLTIVTIELYLPYIVNPYFLICDRKQQGITNNFLRKNSFLSVLPLSLAKKHAKDMNINYKNRVDEFVKQHPNLPVLFLPYGEVIQDPKQWVFKIIDFLKIQPADHQIQGAIEFIR